MSTISQNTENKIVIELFWEVTALLPIRGSSGRLLLLVGKSGRRLATMDHERHLTSL